MYLPRKAWAGKGYCVLESRQESMVLLDMAKCPMLESDREKFSMMFALGINPGRCEHEAGGGIRCAMPAGHDGKHYTGSECGIVHSNPVGCLHNPKRVTAMEHGSPRVPWCY